jgi:hypothetical protein
MRLEPSLVGCPAAGAEHVVPDLSNRSEPVLPDVASTVLQLERQSKGRKLIAMSLYGADPRYTQNVVYNAMRARDEWPGWTLRVYYGHTVPQQILELVAAFGAETVPATRYRADASMFWRFFALEDRTATRVIFRDADALLSARDRAAVEEWIATGWPMHIMHDHPFHDIAILGGMWGAVSGYVNPKLLEQWRGAHGQPVGSTAHEASMCNMDQVWLQDVLWPVARNSTLSHASFHCQKYRAAEWRPFPTLRTDSRDFVGQVYSIKSRYVGDFEPEQCPEECRQPAAIEC